MGSALRILGVIAALMAYLVTGPILGERLQARRLPGVARLNFPGRALGAWGDYLDASRYRPDAARYLWALRFLYLVLPFAALAGALFFFS